MKATAQDILAAIHAADPFLQSADAEKLATQLEQIGAYEVHSGALVMSARADSQKAASEAAPRVHHQIVAQQLARLGNVHPLRKADLLMHSTGSSMTDALASESAMAFDWLSGGPKGDAA